MCLWPPPFPDLISTTIPHPKPIVQAILGVLRQPTAKELAEKRLPFIIIMATAGEGTASSGGCEEGAWAEEREAKIKALLAQMTQQEKIMQIGQIDKTYLKSLEEISELAFGSIISGGSAQVRIPGWWCQIIHPPSHRPKQPTSHPVRQTTIPQPFENSPLGFADMVDEFQSYALKSRLQIPLLYAGDAVHGSSTVCPWACRG